jgi:NADPH-dependent 2,4-dienoyl-CoA reductase/sulfur reductase-like enzyme
VLTADLHAAATGVKPNIEFLLGSGIATKWGVTVDDHLRTSAPDVWAAGDIVEAPDRATGEAYVHAIFPNVVEPPRVAAANMLGDNVTYAGAESMNSLRHLGLPIMAIGAADGADELRCQRGTGCGACSSKLVGSSGSVSPATSLAGASCGRSCSGRSMSGGSRVASSSRLLRG